MRKYQNDCEVGLLKKTLKILGKIVLILLAVVLVAAVGLFGWLTVTEYKPADTEPVSVAAPAFSSRSPAVNSVAKDTPISVLTMNIGYGALGKDSDFFMDGGKQTRPDSSDVVTADLAGIEKIISDHPADFVLLQEVDTDSDRCYGINEKEQLIAATGMTSAFALNYSCGFVPFPLPPIGKVHSGLLTLSRCTVTSADRVSLPCPFSWPVRTANLKRCLLVSRIPVEGSDNELVLINLHLEAYDDGEGKIAQTELLLSLLEAEYAKGNYVIAGGDFNQIFPQTELRYPNEHPDLWAPGVLEQDAIPAQWQYAFDPETPTCRLLNQPYDPADTVNTQYYVIDGFIVSPNITAESVETLDEGFVYSDHNPVLLSVLLK